MCGSVCPIRARHLNHRTFICLRFIALKLSSRNFKMNSHCMFYAYSILLVFSLTHFCLLSLSFHLPIIAEHHVHFDQTTLKDEDFETDNTCVTYQQVGENIVNVHLGFLQHRHRYLLELHLPAHLFKCQTSTPINLVADNNIAANEHCKLADRVTELYKDPNGSGDDSNETTAHSTPAKHASTSSSSSVKKEKFFVIKVEYFAHKEKLLREELKLVNANNAVELLRLIVSARVLGKGKGTPMLRNGIHCLSYDSDNESNKSDYQPTLASAAASK